MKYATSILLSCLFLAPWGCALFSKGEATFPRYFSPDIEEPSARAARKASGMELRLGRVSAGSYLSERIAFRESKYEVGFYDDRFWTEKPEEYLRRSLKRVLFEEEGVRQVLSSRAPTLDAELVNFEEVKVPARVARVRIAFSVHDDRVTLLQDTVAVERQIVVSDQSHDAYEVARALGDALREAVQQVSARILSDLATATRKDSRFGSNGID